MRPMTMQDGPVLACELLLLILVFPLLCKQSVFSLSEDEQECLDPFVPSYWKALQAGGDILMQERELIWNHWELKHPHLFLALSGYRRSPQHIQFARDNKMEVSQCSLSLSFSSEFHRFKQKIEAYLRRIGFIMDGIILLNPFTIAQ